MTEGASLSAPYTLEFPFERTVGPKIGTFFAGLKERRLFGARAERGVVCPPLEFDPDTGAETGELVELAPAGTVATWTWARSRAGDPVARDFAWALVAIDGTAGSFFHAVDVGGDPSRMQVGMRVRVRWRGDRVGDLRDIECFEVAP
ncbi:Zn-ribbon domain-containing OB-fold protein [Qaidamihabitans albus]|uniref:Zn-ribbon domain-containing OB-fold protein n=1 Tax=Qaidamihabitans albus TaxID=2795733 RepID=UPI0018F13B2D|nr:OB-fold domain-containing protein [Qaidamihabitans albus]